MITSKILAHSVNKKGCQLVTYLLTYPRFIHSEFMTHRCFSRNAASSRAIPFAKMVEAIENNPAMPEYWGAEQKGMQSGKQLSENEIAKCEGEWMCAKTSCSFSAKLMKEYGLHKSLCNRIIEPWSHITVLATTTLVGLNNFFALRASSMAMPEFQVLAFRMLNDYINSKPKEIEDSDWHIPEFGGMEAKGYNKIAVATARCARLSYLTHEGEHSLEKDMELHDRLAEAGHWSPFEHCAQATSKLYSMDEQSNFDLGGLSGWIQYRKKFKTELTQTVDHQKLMNLKPDWITL